MSVVSIERVCEDSNNEILGYFSKFSGCDNYDEYYKSLDKLSKIRFKGHIEVGRFKMPNIGPSDDLVSFPGTIKNWKKEDIFEIKNVIKLYDSGEIESIEEAIILIEIAKRKENYPKILDTIISDLHSVSLNNIENYSEILNTGTYDENSLIYGSIWKYLITLSCE